ncbi:hypothetical protein Tco_1166801 [Tanacetum coccineum]
MSNTNNNLQTQTSNALHNAIMEAWGKDRPPMLALGNYVQWKSRIKKYIDTKPNSELIHYCLANPPHIFTWVEQTNSDSEDNDIYSTVDACPNACEIWKVIERLKQGKSINVQDLETNLYWEFGKFTSRDGESLESSYFNYNQNGKGKSTNLPTTTSELNQTPVDQIRIILQKQIEEMVLEAHYLYMAQIQKVTPDAADNSGPIFDAKPLQKVQHDDDNYNMFANEREHPEQPKSANDTYPDEHNIIIDSLDMSHGREQDDQDGNDDLAKEHDLLASLIEKLKYEIDDSKNQIIHNKTWHGYIDPVISSTIETNFDPSIHKLMTNTKRFFQSLKEEMVVDLKYFNSLENEIESLQSQLVTQRTQFLNEIDRLSREYYYADHMNPILGVYTTLYEFTDLQCDYVDQVVKCEGLEKELSKSNTTSKSFEALQQHAIDLELALQQCQE